MQVDTDMLIEDDDRHEQVSNNISLVLKPYGNQNYPWLEEIQNDSGYNSDESGSRPLKNLWPPYTMLTPEHFTIEQQRCLRCEKLLGYALPMKNSSVLPNPKFLFCHFDDGTERCHNSDNFLKCNTCGNFNNENTGAIVFKPGNSAYEGQSYIYSFMCFHCHKLQMEEEPGLEECREAMKTIREARRKEELQDAGLAPLDMDSSFGVTKMNACDMVNKYFPSSEVLKKQSKKRKLED